VVKIAYSSSEVVLRIMKHIVIYPGLDPSSKVIYLRLMVWYRRLTCVTRGEQRAREVCVVKRGNGSHPSCLKGRGPFIAHAGVC
jgi:hypothetical protein